MGSDVRETSEDTGWVRWVGCGALKLYISQKNSPLYLFLKTYVATGDFQNALQLYLRTLSIRFRFLYTPPRKF